MGAIVREEYDHFIGGKWRKSGSGKTIDVLNPATGELLTRVAAGDRGDVDAAVAAAREAFVAWGKTSPVERQGVLLEIADRIRKRARDYAELETMNVGKPIRETVNIDIPLVIDHYLNQGEVCSGGNAPSIPCSNTPRSRTSSSPRRRNRSGSIRSEPDPGEGLRPFPLPGRSIRR